MSYKEDMPDFMANPATTYVNERYDVTTEQSAQLKLIKEELGIPPSAIIRLALNTFLPKLRDAGFKYAGIKEVWDRSKF